MTNEYRMMHIRKLTNLKWTKEQEEKLANAFGLIDEVLWECEQKNKTEEIQALVLSKYLIEPIVTAFSLKNIALEINNEKG